MISLRTQSLYRVLAIAVASAAVVWIVGSQIESPADAAARTAPPNASPILVPVEQRVLSSSVVTRGTARFGLPKAISLPPSLLKPSVGLITTLPLPNTQMKEGDVLLTASGRPAFVVAGNTPAYRDLTPGISGDDVRQLEAALTRLGFDPGPVDGTYDRATSAAVEKWYRSSGWDPFGATPEQIALVRTLERDLGDATKLKVAADGARAAAALAVDAAKASAEHDARVAKSELAARQADRARLAARSPGQSPLAVESERAKAKYADTAARADVAATIAERARVVLDPRQPETARSAADARLELARAAARKTELESELAIQAAERDAQLAEDRLELAQAAMQSAKLSGELSVRAARDARKVAELDAQLAGERVIRLSDELERARARIGVQVPVDEIVFIPALPARVHEITALVGDAARGPVLSVTDNQVSVDSALPLDTAPLVQPGMKVQIDEQALGIHTEGTVDYVSPTPGTHGVDGYHMYTRISVGPTPTPLAGFSLRLTIPIKSTDGEVTVVPTSALSLAADGRSRVQVQADGELRYVVVEPGLSADGFVEVKPVSGSLSPGQLVVVGYSGLGS